MGVSKLSELQARSTGKFKNGTLRPSESIDAVWEHIRRCLLALAKKSRMNKIAHNEPGLNQQFFEELEGQRGDRPFFFHPEYMDDERNGRRPDFSVRPKDGSVFLVEGIRFADREPFLALEAKRLPTPRASRKREYLEGNLGGVSRFKRGLHAPKLMTIGMIGYIQKYDFSHWLSTINACA